MIAFFILQIMYKNTNRSIFSDDKDFFFKKKKRRRKRKKAFTARTAKITLSYAVHMKK